jgi:hypothetical protein
MLLDKFPPTAGAASPNRVGVVDGGRISMGARREVVSAVTERCLVLARWFLVRWSSSRTVNGPLKRPRLND